MISVSEKAAEEIKRIRANQGLDESTYFRVGIKSGGCSGFSYDVRFDTKKTVIDDEFESRGVRIVVDKKSHIYLNGTEIDYEETLMQRGFVFHNPNAKEGCGCGASFSI